MLGSRMIGTRSAMCIHHPVRSVWKQAARVSPLAKAAKHAKHFTVLPPTTTHATRRMTTVCAAADGSYDYDLFTIGAGSGGVRASRVAAGTYGARVAVCELPFNTIASDTQGGAGGTCVLRGCVPKKLFVYASSFSEEFADARGFGWDVPENLQLDWDTFLAKKNAELRRLNGVYMNILKNNGVEFVEGRGRVLDAHTVEVDGKQYTV